MQPTELAVRADTTAPLTPWTVGVIERGGRERDGYLSLLEYDPAGS